MTNPNDEFAESCAFKLDEARFFLEQIRQVTSDSVAKDADAQRAVLYYSSAFLAAVRAPVGYVLETRTYGNRRTKGQRTKFHNRAIKGMPSMRKVGKIRDTNIHLAPAPGVVQVTVRTSDPDSSFSKTYEPMHDNQLLIPLFEECLRETTIYVVTAKLTQIFTLPSLPAP